MQKRTETKTKAVASIWTHTEEITWYSVRDKLPDYVPGKQGTQVLIWPPYMAAGNSDLHVAFFSDWLSTEPWFYMYGAAVHAVENWAYLPKGPVPVAQVKPAKRVVNRLRMRADGTYRATVEASNQRQETT